MAISWWNPPIHHRSKYGISNEESGKIMIDFVHAGSPTETKKQCSKRHPKEKAFSQSTGTFLDASFHGYHGSGLLGLLTIQDLKTATSLPCNALQIFGCNLDLVSWWFQPTHLKKILCSQVGSSPQVGVNIKNKETTTQTTSGKCLHDSLC